MTPVRNILRAIKNPSLAVSHGRDVATQISKKPFEKLLRTRYGEPTNQLTEDWDNLLLLDACRYDTFADVASLDGNLHSILSPGSATLEWLATAVDNRTFYDTVCVTAQPRIARYEDQFHAVEHVWNWGWDDELNVTPPRPVAEATKSARERYPNKRLFAHFMQPHTPYIGDFAREHIGIRTGDAAGRDRALGEEVSDDDWDHAIDALERGEISKEVARNAYRENLELVLEEVEGLLDSLNGKTVVTADHGDLFGEWAWPYPRRLYDHPPGVPARKLRQVPWFVVDGDRRRTMAEPPERGGEQMDDDHVSARLNQLGYLDE
jgi:hypothetical protein